MATSNFPKMGDEGIPHSVVNLSGERRPYTIPVARKGPKGADIPGVGTKSNRSSALNNEAHGPHFTPQAKICYENSPEQSKTQQNTRYLNGGFWTKRAEGPRIG